MFSSSMVGVLIWMSYRASLASRLAINEYHLPFNSVDGLADNGEYRYKNSLKLIVMWYFYLL